MILQVVQGMSNDSKYLYDMCVAIEDELYDMRLFQKKIGPMMGARWLTFGGRGLRGWVSANHLRLSAAQMEILERVVTFILQAYYKVRIHLYNCDKFVLIFISSHVDT